MINLKIGCISICPALKDRKILKVWSKSSLFHLSPLSRSQFVRDEKRLVSSTEFSPCRFEHTTREKDRSERTRVGWSKGVTCPQGSWEKSNWSTSLQELFELHRVVTHPLQPKSMKAVLDWYQKLPLVSFFRSPSLFCEASHAVNPHGHQAKSCHYEVSITRHWSVMRNKITRVYRASMTDKWVSGTKYWCEDCRKYIYGNAVVWNCGRLRLTTPEPQTPWRRRCSQSQQTEAFAGNVQATGARKGTP